MNSNTRRRFAVGSVGGEASRRELRRVGSRSFIVSDAGLWLAVRERAHFTSLGTCIMSMCV